MEKTERNIPARDCFQLFCREVSDEGSGFPQISRIRPIFENMTLEEFIDMVDRISATNDYDLTTQFFYFMLLFRDMPHLQRHINSGRFTTKYLEKFIIFVYGFCSLHEKTTGGILDDILYFISSERLLELALKSEYISRDKLLLFFILTKLDTRELNLYFASIRDIAGFKNNFMRLPDEIIRTMISRNYQLFQYIMMLMLDGDSEGDIYAEFFSRYRAEIEQFSRLHDFIRDYRKTMAPDMERTVPFNLRNMGRISQLVNMIKDLPNPEKAIQYFNSESIFVDEFEKNIIRAVVNNPVMKNIFQGSGAPGGGKKARPR